jgi:hypothetical protein
MSKYPDWQEEDFRRDAEEQSTRLLNDDFQLVNFSLVPASRCSDCGTSMTAASKQEWACTNANCAQKDRPVHTGVYPLQPGD